MSKITINRGSDLTFTGSWRQSDGTAIDMTGWTIAPYDTHPSMNNHVTATWIDASQGAYSVTMHWDDAMPNAMNFRLKVSNGTSDLSSPLIVITAQ